MGGKVALTFDDGPDPVWTPGVLDALAKARARATFFVMSRRAKLYPEVLARTRGAGHEVSFHCAEHRRHDRLAIGEIRADAAEGLDVLGRLGYATTDWRTPWGMVTPQSREVAAELGLRLVGWTADSKDWRGDDAGKMLARLEPKVADGAVVIMHDGPGPGVLRTGCAETVSLIGPLVALLRSRGLEPAPVGELVGALPDRNPEGFSGV